MDELMVSSPEILGGEPCIKGTRLSVAFILELMAGGATSDQILDACLQSTRAGVEAALEYAARALRNEVVWELEVSA